MHRARRRWDEDNGSRQESSPEKSRTSPCSSFARYLLFLAVFFAGFFVVFFAVVFFAAAFLAAGFFFAGFFVAMFPTPFLVVPTMGRTM